jgi:hypothetical protein
MFAPESLQVLNAIRSQLAREGKPERNAIILFCSPRKADQDEAKRLLEAAKKAA